MTKKRKKKKRMIKRAERKSGMPYRVQDDVIDSDLITVDERQLRVKMALQQVEFFTNLETTVSDPEWSGKDHPFVKRQGRTDFEISFRLKIKKEKDELVKELVVLNKAIEEDLDLPEDDDEY